MSSPPLHAEILGAVNHAIGVERGGSDPDPNHDPERPRDAHPSHSWELAEGGRWLACRKCGLRDYWPGCEVRCKVPGSKATSVTLQAALVQLAADLEAFARWWSETGESNELPTVDEWAANFHEWRIAR